MARVGSFPTHDNGFGVSPSAARALPCRAARAGASAPVVDGRARSTYPAPLIRLTGVGLIRKSTKTETGERILTLPRFVITTLRARDPDGDALGPVFPDTLGGWRDPSNTRRALRDARGSEGFAWVTSHVFRRTCATILDQSGQSSRSNADQLGHAQVSMTQNFYLGRRIANPSAAAALDAWHDQEDELHG